MTLKMNFSVLLIILLASCNFKSEHRTQDVSSKIIISDIEIMPDDIEGCACYLSRDNESFEEQKHIFASNSDSTCYMMINSELIKFKMKSTTNEPFTFKDHDLIEKYESDKYQVIIESHFEDSTSYESWNFNGIISISNRSGDEEKISFVGTCGC